MNQDHGDWIEWSGDECPVPKGTRVAIRTDAAPTSNRTIFSAERVNWNNAKRSNKLRSYRIVEAA